MSRHRGELRLIEMKSKLSCGRECGREGKDRGAAEVCFGELGCHLGGLTALGRRCRGLGLAGSCRLEQGGETEYLESAE